jgi:hypothetical protein
MAIMYTYITRSSVDGNLSVVGSAKKAISRGVEHLREKLAQRYEEAELADALKVLDGLDTKELAKTARDEGKVEFGVAEMTILVEKFHLG